MILPCYGAFEIVDANTMILLYFAPISSQQTCVLFKYNLTFIKPYNVIFSVRQCGVGPYYFLDCLIYILMMYLKRSIVVEFSCEYVTPVQWIIRPTRHGPFTFWAGPSHFADFTPAGFPLPFFQDQRVPDLIISLWYELMSYETGYTAICSS